MSGHTSAQSASTVVLLSGIGGSHSNEACGSRSRDARLLVRGSGGHGPVGDRGVPGRRASSYSNQCLCLRNLQCDIDATTCMVSRENAVIVTSLLVALAVGAGLVQYTDAPSWVAMAVFIVLGVVVPTAINESSRRDRGVE